MITQEFSRAGLVSSALNDLRWQPEDGRSAVHHLDVVWCNYSDGFFNAESFLEMVAMKLRRHEVGRLAASMLANNVRTKLCR